MGTNRHLRLAGAGLLAAAIAAFAPAVPRVCAEEAWVVESEGYTLREAPKLGARAVGRVKVGEKVAVLGRTQGWAQVQIGERTGWMVEGGVGAQAPASLRLGPLQERLTGLEESVGRIESERAALQEQNQRLGARVEELEQSLARARKEAVDARASGRFREMALGGGLVILGWIGGYALAAHRRRSGGTRYTIG